MRTRKAAPRGKELEQKFDRWLEHWDTIPGVLAMRLHVERTYKGNVHKRKQPCDYVIVRARYEPSGRQHNEIWMLDSKECSSKKFYPKKQAEHQRHAFFAAQQQGWQAGFVVWFRECDPAGVNLRLITNLRDPATIKDGFRFDWGEFFS